jgi:hypothetical protein
LLLASIRERPFPFLGKCLAAAVFSTESREYFDEVLNFARRKGTVRRIIGIGNDAMANWCVTRAATRSPDVGDDYGT